MILLPGIVWAAEAVQPPGAPPTGGLPTHLPPGTAEAYQRVLNDSVLGSLLVIFIGLFLTSVWIIWKLSSNSSKALRECEKEHGEEIKELTLAINKERAEWAAILHASHESRITLLREVMTALGNSTAAISISNQSVSERTVSAQMLSEKIKDLVRSQSDALQSFRSISEQLLSQGRSSLDTLNRMSQSWVQRNGGPP